MKAYDSEIQTLHSDIEVLRNIVSLPDSQNILEISNLVTQHHEINKLYTSFNLLDKRLDVLQEFFFKLEEDVLILQERQVLLHQFVDENSRMLEQRMLILEQSNYFLNFYNWIVNSFSDCSNIFCFWSGF